MDIILFSVVTDGYGRIGVVAGESNIDFDAAVAEGRAVVLDGPPSGEFGDYDPEVFAEAVGAAVARLARNTF